MNINLKAYQEKAISDLIAKATNLLSNDTKNSVCVFQAPTGSGKTLMTAKFIQGLIIEKPDLDMCFIWISIGKGNLHLQSKHGLEKVFGGFPRVSLVEDEFSGGREHIVRNEVVVVNWEKLRLKDSRTGEWRAILMKDGEKVNFREVLTKTREERKIVMIIDESHIGATALRTNEIRDEIDADLILEMSATPHMIPSALEITRGTAGMVVIDPKEVIEEGMIKKELIINEHIDDIAENENDSQLVVLEAAYQKRIELKKLFEIEGSAINPLVLIQIPPAVAGDDKIVAIRAFLSDKGVSERINGQGNGKLAIWLSEQKSETLDWISEPDNEIEFLIFKQAIDTGWDCPRAHILVKFRETHSETFEIQTVGRILRMPEQKHYAQEDLNRGYIYTNIESIIIKKEEYNPNIIKHLKAIRIEEYQPLKLHSYYKSRADYGDIGASFSKVFEDEANKFFGIEEHNLILSENIRKVEDCGINLDIERYHQNIIRDTPIEVAVFDETSGKIDAKQRVSLNIAGNDLQAMFESVLVRNFGSFKSTKRSLPDVKTAIYAWFRKYLGAKDWPEHITMIQVLFITKQNIETFAKILISSIEKYKSVREEEVKQRIVDSEQSYEFNIADEAFYNEHLDEQIAHHKYVYNPCYLSRDRSDPEKNFEKFILRNCEKLLWWWKNGENKHDYFGVKYEYPEGVIHTFYPDYLIRFIDGRLGIFEVKHFSDRDGETYTKAKAEKLQEYINNLSDSDLFGGIVIMVNNAWRINQKEIYDWEKCQNHDWSEWEELAF